jgi:hypothetical protein
MKSFESVSGWQSYFPEGIYWNGLISTLDGVSELEGVANAMATRSPLQGSDRVGRGTL